MAHGVNLLREHVPQETRMHYVVIKGGTAANVVPDETEVSLIVRHPDAKTLENIWERVLNCVQAGALATGTQVSFEITSSYANLVPVRSMISLMNKSLQTAGGVNYSPEERKFAEALRSNVDLTNAPPLGTEATVLPTRTALVSASTDVGDVSWNVPTGQVLVATFPPGIPLHTWLSTACAGTSLARKGMVVAAKTLALAATDLLSNPELVKAAKQDWQEALKGRAYRSLLPADRKPSPR
jgi:aminobenzoyl-glutamate utilization protein B